MLWDQGANTSNVKWEGEKRCWGKKEILCGTCLGTRKDLEKRLTGGDSETRPKRKAKSRYQEKNQKKSKERDGLEGGGFRRGTNIS